MVRKANSKRKGIQKGVQRGAVTKRTCHTRHSAKWFSAFEQLVETMVIMIYGMVMRVCIALNLVPFTKTEEGLFMLKSKKQVLAYNFYKVFTGLIMMYRAGVAIKLCTQAEITSEALLAIVEGLSYFDAWLISVYDAEETVILLNAFEMILSRLQTQLKRELRMFDDLRLSLKAIGTIQMMLLSILIFSMVNGLLFGGLQTSWIRLADGYIDIPLPGRFWWQLLFLPLEIITVAPILFTACPVCISTFSSLHIFKVFGEGIRNMRVVDSDSREEVRRMYVYWELYEKITRPWMVAHSIYIIVSIACAATIYIFMAIKYTTLPILIYSNVAVMGPGFLVLLFLGIYDGVLAGQLSEGILLDHLSAFRAPGLRNISLKRQRELKIEMRAMRPIRSRIGKFTDCEYTVMVAIWEEIVNQVLFLLSL